MAKSDRLGRWDVRFCYTQISLIKAIHTVFKLVLYTKNCRRWTERCMLSISLSRQVIFEEITSLPGQLNCPFWGALLWSSVILPKGMTLNRLIKLSFWGALLWSSVTPIPLSVFVDVSGDYVRSKEKIRSFPKIILTFWEISKKEKNWKQK